MTPTALAQALRDEARTNRDLTSGDRATLLKAARVVENPNSKVTVTRDRKPAGGEFTAQTRQLIIRRAGGRCELCGAPGTNIHHRRARGMGGDRRAATRQASNGVLVCGSGNASGCHGQIETDPTSAQAAGLRVPRHENPADISVRLLVGRVWLTDDGRYSNTPPTEETQ